MIGLEGSEWGKFDQVGNQHNISAKSTIHSPTWGYKWWKKDKSIPSLESLGGPDKYNSMLIDLTKSGWTYLIELTKSWKNEMVGETSVEIS